MKKVMLKMNIYLPDIFYITLQKYRKKLKSNDGKLSSIGDRDIEWSWIASQMPFGPGEALDFGCGRSYLSLIAARHRFNVTALDLLAVDFPYKHPRINFIQGNILNLRFARGVLRPHHKLLND